MFSFSPIAGRDKHSLPVRWHTFGWSVSVKRWRCQLGDIEYGVDKPWGGVPRRIRLGTLSGNDGSRRIPFDGCGRDVASVQRPTLVCFSDFPDGSGYVLVCGGVWNRPVSLGKKQPELGGAERGPNGTLGARSRYRRTNSLRCLYTRRCVSFGRLGNHVAGCQLWSSRHISKHKMHGGIRYESVYRVLSKRNLSVNKQGCKLVGRE